MSKVVDKKMRVKSLRFCIYLGFLTPIIMCIFLGFAQF